jgi:hypothetical protein
MSSPIAAYTSRVAGWLIPRRLRSQGLILAICIWGVVAVDFATPSLVDRAGNIKFQDFLSFYVSGRLASQHRAADLYNGAVTAQVMREIVPESSRFKLPILYGPQVALFFQPLGAMPFLAAALLWTTISLALYAACSLVLWRQCPRLHAFPVLAVILALAFPPFFHTIVRGQNSALALASFVAAFLAFGSDQHYLAGLALGTLVFKPQLAVAALIVMLAAFAGKVLTGFLVSVATQLGIAWAFAGTATLRLYVDLLWHFRKLLPSIEPSLSDAHCLRALWEMLLPWPAAATAAYAISAVAVLAMAIVSWKSPGPLALRFSSLLIATVLVSPHLYVYDLLILAPMFLLLADWLVDDFSTTTHSWVAVLLYLAFLLTLIAPITRITHVQFSVPVLVALQWMLYRILHPSNAAYLWQPGH